MGDGEVTLLDTHTWVWWQACPEKLSKRATASLDSSPELGISAISLVEVARLATRGRLVLNREVGLWLRIALAQERIELLPITPEIAVRAATFDERYPRDPADRIIVATAVQHHAKLVTKDGRLLAIDGLNAIW